MSRKQEVIKIFRGRLAQARCFSLYDAQHGAECLYDLIAPLMGRECQHKNRVGKYLDNPKWYWCEDCKQAVMTEWSGG